MESQFDEINAAPFRSGKATVDSLSSALEAVERGSYDEAIAVLEMYEQLSLNPRSEQYIKVRQGLIECYSHTGKTDKAIWNCQQLIANENVEIQLWAQEKRDRLLGMGPETPDQATTKPPTQKHLKTKTLNEFKSYWKKHLFEELQKFEQGRKQALRAVIVSGGIFLAIAIPTVVGMSKSATEYMAYANEVQSYRAQPTRTITPRFGRKRNSFGIDPTSIRRTGEKARAQQSADFYGNAFLFCAFVLLISLIVWISFYSSCLYVYGMGFKSKIIQKIVDFFDEDNNLTYGGHLTIEAKYQTRLALIHSQIFKNLGETGFLQQEDCVYGKIGQTDLFFSEIYATTEDVDNSTVSLEYNPWTRADEGFAIALLVNRLMGIMFHGIPRLLKGQQIDSQSINKKIFLGRFSKNNFFKGLFFRANFNKNFSGQTLVLPNDLESKVPFSKPENTELVKLEDPEFNRFFSVYGDDQIEARYILSTSLMDKLVAFRKKARKKIYVSFVESKIYIAIRCDRDIFEPKLYESMLSFAPMQEYFEDMQLMIGIVEELSLNRRIWAT